VPAVSFTTLNWSNREHDGVRAVLRFGEAEQIVEAVLNWLRFRSR